MYMMGEKLGCFFSFFLEKFFQVGVFFLVFPLKKLECFFRLFQSYIYNLNKVQFITNLQRKGIGNFFNKSYEKEKFVASLSETDGLLSLSHIVGRMKWEEGSSDGEEDDSSDDSDDESSSDMSSSK